MAVEMQAFLSHRPLPEADYSWVVTANVPGSYFYWRRKPAREVSGRLCATAWQSYPTS